MPNTGAPGECRIPEPHRHAVENCEPVIPQGVQKYKARTGRWPKGIQEHLEATRDCCPPTEAEPLGGCFPWGWYRDCEGAEDPIEPPRLERDPVGFETGLSRTDLPGGSAQIRSCLESANLPTVDVMAPYGVRDSDPGRPANGYPPLGPMHATTGTQGLICIRIPGSNHPLFGTGLTLLAFPSGSGAPYAGRWVPGLYHLFDEPGAGALLQHLRWSFMAYALAGYFCPLTERGRLLMNGDRLHYSWRNGGELPALEAPELRSADHLSGGAGLVIPERQGMWSPNDGIQVEPTPAQAVRGYLNESDRMGASVLAQVGKFAAAGRYYAASAGVPLALTAPEAIETATGRGVGTIAPPPGALFMPEPVE